MASKKPLKRQDPFASTAAPEPAEVTGYPEPQRPPRRSGPRGSEASSSSLTSRGRPGITPELEAQLETRERRRARARKEKRPKATYDLSMKLIESVQEVARGEDVSQSDVVAWALIDFLVRYHAGDVNLDDYKQPARSLRFAYKLEFPEEWK